MTSIFFSYLLFKKIYEILITIGSVKMKNKTIIYIPLFIFLISSIFITGIINKKNLSETTINKVEKNTSITSDSIQNKRAIIELKAFNQQEYVKTSHLELEENISDATGVNLGTKETINVQKSWLSSQDLPSSVTLELTKDGETIKTWEVTAENNWSLNISDITDYIDYNSSSTYALNEVATNQDELNGYYGQATFSKDSSDNIELIYRNSIETKTINAEKIWNDENNKYGKRPESITFILTGSDGSEYEAEVTSDSEWKYTFSGLPLKDSTTGEEIIYTLDEKETSEFYTKEINNYVITNTFQIPNTTIDIDVNVEWRDSNNEQGTRPEEVTLQIFNSEGTVLGEQIVKAENNWQTTFTVPKYDNTGNEATYKVDSKDSITKYDKTINKYTLILKLDSPIKTTEENPNTAASNIKNIIVIAILALAGIATSYMGMKKYN